MKSRRLAPAEFTLLSVGILLSVCNNAAVAATVQLGATAGLELPADFGNTLPTDESSLLIDTLTDEPVAEVVASISADDGAGGRGEASGRASFDLRTGELRAFASHVPYVSGSNAGYASASVTMIETFSVSGAGRVRLVLDVSGSWDYGCANSDPALCISAIAAIGFTSPSQGVEDRISETFDTNGSQYGFVRRLTSTLEVQDARSYGIIAALSAQMLPLAGSAGTVDMGSTAVLSVFSDPGIALSFNDPAFLSERPPSPIPLPPPFALIGLSVFALVVAKRSSVA
jgi:hypothetical protein